MSTQREEQTDDLAAPERESDRDQADRSTRRFVRAMRLLAALSALLSLLALWSVEGRQLSHDLQLAAEPRVRPGDRIALRALIFSDVEALEGPTLAVSETTVRLLDNQQRELARVQLEPSALDTLDGSLHLPEALAGHFTLEARTRYRDTDLVCRRALEVAVDAPPLRLVGRQAGAMQQLSVGLTRRAETAPVPLLPRVVGGACVPGETCRLLVWVGEPSAAITARADWGVELVKPPEPSDETHGIVELQLVVRGLDAQLTLEAQRAGALVGERPVRLPIGLGEGGDATRDSILEPDHLALKITAPPGRRWVTLDYFDAARWSGLQVFEPSDREHEVPGEVARPGLLRVQLRADRLSSEGSSSRVFVVRAPGQDDARLLSELAGSLASVPALAEEPTREWARVLPAFALTHPQRTAAFLLAPLEQLHMPVPLPVSGRPAQLRGLEHTRTVFRFGVSGALVLSAFVLALSIARRGLLAADEAQSILDLARSEGDNEVSTPRQGEVFSARLRVLLLALAVAAAFLAAALLIAAKPLWF